MKLLTAILISLMMVTLSSALAFAQPACSPPAALIDWNPENTIVVCDDPNDNTCEEDFGTLCPTGYHLCSYTEFNAGNDNWAGTSGPYWYLGEIQCRHNNIGAGHFSLYSGTTLSNDQANNKIAGSSLPQCPATYGCNEQYHHALCCGDPGVDQNGPVNDIPEFTTIAGLGIAALAGSFIFFRRRK